MARGTRRDLAACFAWKQVRLGFFSLTSRLTEARRRVVYMSPLWMSREDQVEDGRVDTTGCIGPFYLKIVVFYVLATGTFYFCNLLVELINKTVDGWDYLSILLVSYPIIK
jgi:hypothetical protein